MNLDIYLLDLISTRIMKKLIIISIAIINLLMAGCKKDESKTAPGSIYGTVTDKATGECVSAAGVELMPKGLKTVTGSDGTFQFTEIDPGEYNLFITKSGYQDLKSSTITVKSGEQAKGDVQIEKLPSVLRIVNSDGEDISDLDFGAESDVTSRTFSIFNDSPRRITWWIEENCNWITEVKSMLSNEQSGTIVAGEQEPIKVTIDRSLLAEGLQSYILNINSDNGSKELLITAGEDMGLPSLTTDPVSDLTQNSATFNGTITSEGLPSYTERGFVYSTTAQPTIENHLGKITSAVNSQTSFSANVSGLSSNSSYYVRAYAINTVGVAYGNDVSFSTGSVPTTVTTSAVTNINASSATLNATITEVGSPAYTEKGFCYNKTGNPNISNNKVIVDGSGAGVYSKTINNLEYHTTYHVKAYAIQNGQIVYGNEVNFSTSWADTQVQTSGVSNIAATSATFNGIIIEQGSPAYTERGFCYSNYSSQPTISNNKVMVSGSGVAGNYYKNITNLIEGETYYVRAYVIQNGVAIYGSTVEFTTNELPVVYTNDISNLTPVSSAGIILSWNVTFNGYIESVGNPQYVERGFFYDTYSDPTANKQIVSGNGTGSFSKKITGLRNYQIYYVRAYAKTASGEYVYGQTVSFSTFDWK